MNIINEKVTVHSRNLFKKPLRAKQEIFCLREEMQVPKKAK